MGHVWRMIAATEPDAVALLVRQLEPLAADSIDYLSQNDQRRPHRLIKEREGSLSVRPLRQ